MATRVLEERKLFYILNEVIEGKPTMTLYQGETPTVSDLSNPSDNWEIYPGVKVVFRPGASRPALISGSEETPLEVGRVLSILVYGESNSNRKHIISRTADETWIDEILRYHEGNGMGIFHRVKCSSDIHISEYWNTERFEYKYFGKTYAYWIQDTHDGIPFAIYLVDGSTPDVIDADVLNEIHKLIYGTELPSYALREK